MPLDFLLGRIVMARQAFHTLPAEDVFRALARHAHCDWGEVCEEDRNANDQALRLGGRLLSVYHTGSRVKFWIITEADRSATTVLLPEEY
jgi:hypothetical protein